MKNLKVPTLAAVCLVATSAVLLAATPAPAPLGDKSELQGVRGITEPYRSLILKAGGKRQPPWSGKIGKVMVQEGDTVEVGSILVELEHGEEEIEARMRKLIAESDAELRSASERTRVLGSISAASRALYERTKSISKEDIEKKELEFRLAGAELERLKVVKERERLESELASESLAKRMLRSPIRGIVNKVFMHDGESCEPVDPLIQVVDISRGYFVGNVEEKIGRALSKGQSVELRVQTGAELSPVTGTISFVSPVVDPSSNLMLVKVEFQNPTGQIRPGVPGIMIIPQSK